MRDSRNLRRAVVEMDPGVAQTGCEGIGSHSIHQFWHLFAPHFRGVLLAPRRRADNGNVTWGWRETADGKPLTAAELAEVRLRLSNASRSLTGGAAGQSPRASNRDDSDDEGLDAQVRIRVEKMAAALVAKSDHGLIGFVCRTENGPMLHSWGAANPVQPVFPDAQQGEISGRVLTDGTGAAGLSVVLENPAGLVLTRIKSDSSGAFRFQDISPGRYRLRVADRSDFPAEGWPIHLERTALTGLELSGGSANPTAGVHVENPRPNARRRWPAILLALLALLGVAGAGLWRFKRRAAVPITTGESATGWQTASGKLAASTGAPAATDARRVGNEGGWSDLSRKLPDPKMRNSHPHLAAAGAGIPTGETRPVESPDSAMMGKQPNQLSDATGAPAGPQPVRPGLKQAGPAQSVSKAPPSDRASAESEDETHGNGEPTESTKPDDTSAGGPARTEPTRRRPTRLGTSLTASDTVEREQETPGTTLSSSTTSITTDANTAVKPAASVSAAGRPGAGEAHAAPGADATSSTGPQTMNGSSNGTLATNHLAARTAARQREGTGATDGGGASVVASVNAVAEERAAEDVSAETAPAKDKVTPEKRRVAKNPAGPVNADPATTKAPSPAETALGDDAPETPAAAAAKVSIIAGPGKVAATAGAIEGQPTVAETGTDGLKMQKKVRATAWKAELLQDVILPTNPVAVGQEEPLNELREKLMQTQRARMPQTFREPVTQSGFALEFEATGETGLPRWRDAAGAEPKEATVQGNRAELAWTGQAPLRGQEYVLSQGDGREIARISREAGGGAVVVTAPNVHAWFWVAIERGGTERADGAAAASRFNWQLLTGEEIPVSWRRDDRWRDGRGQRLDLPLEDGGMSVSHPLALVDRVTGWAMTCEIGGP